MTAVIVIGAILVLVTGIAAATGNAFWTLPAALAVSTVLLAVVIRPGVPGWVITLLVLAILALIIWTFVAAASGWLIVLMLGVATLGIVMWFGLLGSPNTQAQAEARPNQDLKVTASDLLPEQARCTSDELNKNSMPGAALTWSDSVSTPFASSDTDKMQTEVLSENCGNPTVLAMNIEALSSVPIEDGATIGSVNPWMSEFVSAFNKDSGLSFLTKKVGNGDNLYVTPDFQKYAAMTNTVLLRIKVIGVVSEQSLTNWHVAARSGLAAGEIPRATLNPAQESLPALKMEYTYKTTGQCLFAIGFNTADKRFETLACTTAPKTPTPASTQSVPSPKSTPTTPPAPRPTPPTPPSCPIGQVKNVLGFCVVPKSSNPKDYRQPGDGGKGADVGTGTKPPATVTTPAEVTPPTVTTTQTGGNGTVDTPTAPLGSQSGLTAPGATSAPTTTTTPPNEGGSNNGSVGGL